MKKMLSVALAFLCAVGAFAGCQIVTKIEGTPFSGEVVGLVEQQPHKEKSGYKFCGYFDDKELTKRVNQTFDAIPSGYYAKYQPDRTQLFAYEQGRTGYNYTSVNLEQAIYAEDYKDAIGRYLLYTYNEDRMYTTAATSSLAPILGKKYTAIEVYQGAKEKNKFYDFHDETEMTRRSFEGEELVDYTFTRDTKWRAYLGEAQTTAEGIEYYTVKNQYAVVVGVSSETTIEELKIPSRLGGRTVREISIYAENETFPVKNLTIPSTVDNAMIYLLPHSSEQTLSKITFEEGVNSIQVCSMQTEELVIPSTAYYVDLRRPSYGANAYTEALMVGDQKITVNGGEHYYTEDGLLYSKEGDLVHQFGGRENLILHLNDKVKRVLRRSINGLAKTVYIPENVEYFDLGFNEWSLRYNTLWRDTIMTSINASPVFFVKSEKVLGQWLKEYLKEDVFGFYPFMKAGFRYVLPDASIDVAAILNKYAGDKLTAAEKTELVAYCTPTETTIESYEVVYYEAMELAIINDHMISAATKYDFDQNTWVWPAGAHSFLSEDFEKEELNDWVYRDYYHYHNSTTEE